jgi:hypothetical protein
MELYLYFHALPDGSMTTLALTEAEVLLGGASGVAAPGSRVKVAVK